MISSRKPKVVIDTNVFISGYLFGGNPEKVLKLFKENKIKLLISPETQAELFQKLIGFDLPTEKITELDDLIQMRATRVISGTKITKSRDLNDNMFLELASKGLADYIVTGDRDLLVLKTIGNTNIVTPKEFIEGDK